MAMRPAERVVASIEQSAGKRAIEPRAPIIEHPLALFIPMNRFGRLRSEVLKIPQLAIIDGVIGITHGVLPDVCGCFVRRSICERPYSERYISGRSVRVVR